MGPHRKRQRLLEDGTAAVTAVDTNSTEPAPKEAPRKQLFIRSLAPAVTTDDLTSYFSEHYPIKHALVILDKATKSSKGYGFVTFADAEDAQRAKEELNGTELQGKKIRIDFAESRHRETGDGTDVPGQSHRGVNVGLSAGDKFKAQQEQAKKDGQTPKLLLRNLPWSITTPEQLAKLFQSYGKVHFATLPKKPSGELRGFGFVALRGRKNAERAMAELNGKEIDGRPIAVDWAVDKETWVGLQKGADKEEAEVKSDEEVEDSDDESSVLESSGSESGEDDSGEEDEEDFEDVSDSDEEGGIELEDAKPQRPEYTIFIRNLPFTVDDDILFDHFKTFGALRYARVVLDHETDRPKGTGFVSFFKEEDMVNCLKGVPRTTLQKTTRDGKDGSSITVTHSVLEDDAADPTGKYTMDGRVLQLSRAVNKNEASRLTAEGAASRFARDKDKRRLYLLSEGTIDSKSPLYQKLSPSEIKMREESATLRRRQIQENPSLHLSLTRLSVRNIPRSISNKDLKSLARKAVVGFAADVKAGKRQKLSKEEVIRGGEAMLVAEKMRKKKGKGIVKQAKVVFETAAGSKLTGPLPEDAGPGRSRGYGFIEYYTHRSALMGLRWLNGHAVDYQAKGETAKGKKGAKEALQDKKKRLIVEFAIENANVVARRSDRETKAKEPRKATNTGEGEDAQAGEVNGDKRDSARRGKKRKHESLGDAPSSRSGKSAHKNGAKEQGSGAEGNVRADAKLVLKSRIIQKKRDKKRAARRVRKGKA